MLEPEFLTIQNRTLINAINQIIFVPDFSLPSFGIEIFAQTNSSYQVANRLFQQQRYEEALPILTSIHRQEPQIFEFLNLLVECHLQLKQYDIAEDIIKKSLQNGVNVGFTNILLGELYYIEGDTTKAFSVWKIIRLSSKICRYTSPRKINDET